MKTYRFCVRSRPGGFTEWAEAYDNGSVVKRIDRDVHAETVRDFRARASAELEAQGFKPEENQYSL